MPDLRDIDVLVFIEPKVASFTELQIFRCFACGDMRSIEQKKSPDDQAAGSAQVSLIEAANGGGLFRFGP